MVGLTLQQVIDMGCWQFLAFEQGKQMHEDRDHFEHARIHVNTVGNIARAFSGTPLVGADEQIDLTDYWTDKL